MNDMKKQVKKASLIIVLLGMACLAFGLMSCGDGYKHYVEGPAGPEGANGASGATGATGANGLNAVFGVPTGAPLTDCPGSGGNSDGSYGLVFTMGVDLNGDGILEPNEIQNVAVVCNGSDGTQGLPGIQGEVGATGSQGAPGVSPLYSPVAVIQPCGPNSSQYKEVLLGLEGGFVLSEFSGSSNALTVRNALIPNGSYEDTDDSFCVFTVSSDNAGDVVVAWAAQTCANGYVAVAGSISYDAATSQWSGSN